VRVDDQLMCKNARCRKRFEIPSAQSIVFIWLPKHSLFVVRRVNLFV
jgi:hypothetical protein